jgi:starch-binding outer membrane protein, SusD/RagB family
MKPQIKNSTKLKINSACNFGLKITASLLLAALSFSGCKKFLAIPPPKTLLVTVSVFDNNAPATSAMLTIYSQMFQNGDSWYMAQNMGIYADEMQSYSASLDQVELYTNSLVPSTQLNESWLSYYPYIFEANAVISGLQTSSGASLAVKQQLTGEAYFMRAFWHFYLTNMYGDVPLVLTTDYTVTGTLARSPRLVILQQVVADLKTAQGLLNTYYVDAATDTAATTERVRPNKAAATALLARVYLYLADYGKDASNFVNAETQASEVINNSNYSLSPLNGVFLKNSSETIWQLQTPSNQNFDTQDGNNFILVGAPSNGESQSVTISSQLMDSFEAGDQRKVNWIGSYSTTDNPPLVYYFPYKYKNNTLKNQEYTMVLRLAEQYLIRAEARAMQGNITGSLTDLNTVRSRAGLGNYAGAQDQASVMAAILHERQVEFFSEWGHRWFDLCRTGTAPSVMGSPGNICQTKGGIWGSDNHQLLLPVPQQERNADVNLSQNPGY